MIFYFLDIAAKSRYDTHKYALLFEKENGEDSH